MKKPVFCFLFFLGITSVAHANDYLREKWFDYPDPSTPPKVTARCVQEASSDAPCPTWSEPFRTCRQTICTGHAYTTEVLRVAPTFVISGPGTRDQAVKSAVEGVAAVCAGLAIPVAKAAGAAAPSPEPVTRVAAGLAAGVGSFKTCISTTNVSAIAAGIASQLEFKVESPTHWAPI